MIADSTSRGYKVRNLFLSDSGKLQIKLSETQMPGLMILREKLSKIKPLRGANIAGCLNMTTQTAVFIETLVMLGAKVRWCSSNALSTQDQAAAYIASQDIPVFAWKGQSQDEFLWCLKQTLFDKGQWWPNMFIDDGGELVELAHEHYFQHLHKVMGVCEETTSGIMKYQRMLKHNLLQLAVFDVNNTLTKSYFDNIYGCRESLIDGLKQGLNLMIAGKVAVVCAYGYVGQGCAEILKAYGARVIVTEVNPIHALKAVMDGFTVTTMSEAAFLGDIFITATGNINVIREEHFAKMKDGAVLCNMGHGDQEVDVACLRKYPSQSIKPYVEQIFLPNGKSLILLAEGNDVNLGCSNGNSDFAMSISFTNQTLALIEMWRQEKLEVGIHAIPKEIDRFVAELHLEKLGVKLESLSEKQKEYSGIDFMSYRLPA